MFITKSNKKIEVVPENHPVHEDLIIHNMPSASRLAGSISGASFSAQVKSVSDSATAAQANFKTTGLLIMVGGLVFIGLLVYLSYVYMIRPMTDSPQSVAPQVVTPAANKEADGESNISAPDLENPVEGIETDLLAEKPAEVAISDEGDIGVVEVENSEVIISAPDSDNDGLSDQDEEVFGTDPLLPDTDGDGYPEADEIRQGYNPLGEGRIGAQVIDRLVNDAFGYELSVPALWPQQLLSEGQVLIFTAPDESLVQITAEENLDNISIANWYEQAFPGAELSYDRLRTGPGWEGIMSSDGLNLYITDNGYGRILVVSFISASGQLSYPYVFELMINSLILK